MFVAMAFAASVASAEAPTNFTLQSALDNSKFDLSANKGKTVVLHFLLKTECPYCQKYTREYAKLAATTPDIVHVFIKPDSVEAIKSWTEGLNKEGLDKLPKIYRDPDAKLADRFGIPDGYRFHGQKVHFPALVALDGNGIELFRYIGKNNGDRMSSKDFSVKIESMNSK